MTEYTDDDVTRLADLLGGGLPAFPEETRQRIANHLLEQGVTLPPPPPDTRDALADLLDAARDYMTTEDVGDEWREHARLRLLDALQEADR